MKERGFNLERVWNSELSGLAGNLLLALLTLSVPKSSLCHCTGGRNKRIYDLYQSSPAVFPKHRVGLAPPTESFHPSGRGT